MPECYAHVYYTESRAKNEMVTWLDQRDDVIKVVKSRGYAICRNGDTHWFMSENTYMQWYRGRTYILEGKKYHSDYPLKEGD